MEEKPKQQTGFESEWHFQVILPRACQGVFKVWCICSGPQELQGHQVWLFGCRLKSKMWTVRSSCHIKTLSGGEEKPRAVVFARFVYSWFLWGNVHMQNLNRVKIHNSYFHNWPCLSMFSGKRPPNISFPADLLNSHENISTAHSLAKNNLKTRITLIFQSSFWKQSKFWLISISHLLPLIHGRVCKAAGPGEKPETFLSPASLSSSMWGTPRRSLARDDT